MSRRGCIAVALLCGVGLLTLSCNGNDPPADTAPEGGEVSDEQPVEEEPAPAEGEEAAEQGEEVAEASEPLRSIGVTIYFPSAEGEGLIGESREIFNTASPVERVKQILSDLVAGPTNGKASAAIPRGTRVRQVFVLEDGVAWLDLTDELRAGLPGGSSAELMAIYSIVNSVAMNVPEVRRVGILIEGEPCDTLNGHIDLRRPLPPKFSVLEDWSGREEPVTL